MQQPPPITKPSTGSPQSKPGIDHDPVDHVVGVVDDARVVTGKRIVGFHDREPRLAEEVSIVIAALPQRFGRFLRHCSDEPIVAASEVKTARRGRPIGPRRTTKHLRRIGDRVIPGRVAPQPEIGHGKQEAESKPQSVTAE